ncbi:hypothetical protein C0Q70_12765 [Pomacea canaliculata]|uniref:Chitin-binding type-2 domain-containing protein n=2 Tax=Pomacea canaliculata TaxID=400727 RepID=A0A2T7P2F9_POMCA|nr:hypothetical protein C0Q70_12765 [Pomacea canaliculata]
MSEKDKETVQCQKDCSGLAPGLYQSCTGCDNYLVCTKHGITRLGRCPSNKVWDDKRKKCRKTSLTCKSSASNELDPGTS